MNRKVLVGVASTLIIITIIVAYVIMNRPASPSTRLYLVSEASNASVGQDFSLNISISNVVDMAAWQAKLAVFLDWLLDGASTDCRIHLPAGYPADRFLFPER